MDKNKDKKIHLPTQIQKKKIKSKDETLLFRHDIDYLENFFVSSTDKVRPFLHEFHQEFQEKQIHLIVQIIH